jgi:hypothetical protein
MIEMIFAQAETARALCRKLYRYFVYYAIDAAVEKNVIQPMADLLKANEFSVKPVIAALLKSAHFHDALNMGCVIKNPIDHVAGAYRQLAVPFPDGVDPVKQYAFWNTLYSETSRMQMEVGNPPNVAGWSAYYQEPVFYELWINSDTLPRRVQLTDKLIGSKGFTYGLDKTVAIVDVMALAKATSKPGTVATLIAELADLHFPITVTDVQLKYLKDTMLAGLPDYEWTVEWDEHIAAPDDVKLRAPLETRLRALLRAMMQMAEYQLC